MRPLLPLFRRKDQEPPNQHSEDDTSHGETDATRTSHDSSPTVISSPTQPGTQEPPPLTTNPRYPRLTARLKRFRKLFASWAKHTWLDIFSILLFALAADQIHRHGSLLAAPRLFPLYNVGSGDVVYPQFGYPNRGWIISSRMSGILCVTVPITIFALGQFRIRSFWDFNNAVMGVLTANMLASLFQVTLKQTVGGFRPYFFDVCRPSQTRALISGNNKTGLNGVGFRGMFYSIDACTNRNEVEIHNAMTSFPSGHATVAFSSMVFVFLWMNAKLKVWGNYRTRVIWLALLFAPLLWATFEACCLTIDAAHNWYDILMGAVIGTMFAFASYRLFYAAVWDWRWNHVPLRRTEVVEYEDEFWRGEMEQNMFIRKMGWGKQTEGWWNKSVRRWRAWWAGEATPSGYEGTSVTGTGTSWGPSLSDVPETEEDGGEETGAVRRISPVDAVTSDGEQTGVVRPNPVATETNNGEQTGVVRQRQGHSPVRTGEQMV